MTISTGILDGAIILILEDDYYLATDLQAVLEAEGATVMGPFGDEEATASAIAASRPDCAFIDVNVGNGPSFAVPRVLIGAGVPFAFVTGYDAGTIPDEFADVARFEKPVIARQIIRAAAALLRPCPTLPPR